MPDTTQPDPPRPGKDEQTVQIRTFLIADVRGYTLFTQEDHTHLNQRGHQLAADMLIGLGLSPLSTALP